MKYGMRQGGFILIAAALAFGTASPSVVAAEARLPSFEQADADQDGVLDVAEARTVFPDLTFEDLDDDGILDKREAEQALPGLVYTRDTHEDAEEVVGLNDYIQMAEFYLTKRLRPPATEDAE